MQFSTNCPEKEKRKYNTESNKMIYLVMFTLYYHNHMKIIISSESFTPNISGVAINTELLAENLSKIGHEIYVFSPGETTKPIGKNIKISRY